VGLNAKQISLQRWFRNICNQKYIAYAYDFGAAHLGDPFNYGATLSYLF
jgi:iron complex outermembrane receptor protein